MKRPAARQIFDVEVNGRAIGVVEEVPGAGWASFTNSGRRIGVFERPAEASAAVVRMAERRRLSLD